MRYLVIDREKGYPTLINLDHVIEIRPTPKGVQINFSSGSFITSNVPFDSLLPVFEAFLVNNFFPIEETQHNLNPNTQ